MEQLKEGTYVQITQDRYEELPSVIYGKIMAINTNWDYEIAVSVFGKENKNSSKGYYYFDMQDVVRIDIDVNSMYPMTIYGGRCSGKELTRAERVAYLNSFYGNKFEPPIPFKKEEKKVMKNKQLVKGYSVASVAFGAFNGETDKYGTPKCDGKLVYYALYDDGISAGDYVLCMTGHHGQALGQVREIFNGSIVDELEVCYGREIICRIDYEAYLNRQHKLERIDELKKKMAKKKEELNELAIYQALAVTSPEMADMLKELKELV